MKGPWPYWTPKLSAIPNIPETPLPEGFDSLSLPGEDQDVLVLVPCAEDMTHEIFVLHIRLRHPSMMRNNQASYSRIRHAQMHKNCPAGWFNHIHKTPA